MSLVDSLIGAVRLRIGLHADAAQALAVSGQEVCIDSEEVLQPFFLCEPPEQVRVFILLFCLTVALNLVIHHAGAARFYSLLVQSQVAPNERRGLGYNACRAYGIFPYPRLSIAGFRWVGSLLVVTLLLACDTHLAPRFFLFASFGLYFLYFGQLYCESKHGGHGSLLLPSVIILLALSGGPQGTPWSLVFIKIFLGIVYFAGALSKLLLAVLFRQPWSGSTMQAYLLDAMWSRPHKLAIVREAQRFILTHWWACTGTAVAGLAFELGFLPVVLTGGEVGACAAAAIALLFHLSIGVLQGLDFVPFWCPVFWVFLSDAQAFIGGHQQEPWTTIVARGFEEEPCRVALSAAYILLQVLVSLRFMDLFKGMECLPFSCCPMFAVPRNLFGNEVSGGVMTDLDLREGGHIDFAYNFYPWHTELPMSDEDMKKLPGRVLFWMNTSTCHPLLSRMLQPESLGKEFLLCANFEVPQELRCKINDFVRLQQEGHPGHWKDPAKVSELLDLQESCRASFDALDTQDCRRGVEDEKATPSFGPCCRRLRPRMLRRALREAGRHFHKGDEIFEGTTAASLLGPPAIAFKGKAAGVAPTAESCGPGQGA